MSVFKSPSGSFPSDAESRRPLRPAGLALALCLLASAFPVRAQDAAQAPNPSVQPQDAAKLDQLKTLADAQAKLANRLIGIIAKDNDKATVVVSPASLAGALSLVEIGADDTLKPSIRETLGVTGDGFNALRQATSRRPGTAEGPLDIAGALMIDPSVGPKPEALQNARDAGAEVTVTPFAEPATLAAINKWVSDKTRGRIPSILDKAPGLEGLVALNALFFKDRWKEPFDPKETRPAPFHLVGGDTVQTPLMNAFRGTHRFRSNDRFVAVDLPFASAEYALTLVTTQGEPARAKDFAPVADWLAGGGFESGAGEVTLPRLSLSASLDLKPALKEAGLAVDAGMTGYSKDAMKLGSIRQRVEFKVDEEGAEAAAATAVTALRALEPRGTRFVADRPFVFALRDRGTGLILIAGYVARPGE